MAGDPLSVSMEARLDKLQQNFDSAVKMADDAVQRIEAKFKDTNPDAAGFIDNVRQAAEAPARAAGQAIGAILALAIGSGAVGAAALFKQVESLSALGDRADDLRLPVTLLQAMGVAADQARVPAEKLNSALDQFTSVSKKSADDADKFYKALGNVGGAFVDAFKNAPTQEQRLRVISDALHSTTDEVKRAQLGVEAFGSDNERLLSIIGRGSAEMDEFIRRARDLGLEVDASLVKQAQEARSELQLLARVLTDQFSSALSGLIPILTRILPFFQALAVGAQAVSSIIATDATASVKQLNDELDGQGRILAGLQSQREQIVNGQTSASQQLAQSVREWIKEQTNGGLDLTSNAKDDVKSLDDEIAKVQSRIETLKKLVSQRGASNSQTPPAFKPRPSLGDDTSTDEFDRQVAAINRHIAALQADAAAVGLTKAQHEQLRAELALLQAAQRAGDDVTNEQIDKYALLRASMSSQQAMAAAGITLNKEHAASFDTVSARMLAAAENAQTLQKNFMAINAAAQFGGNQLIDIMDGLRQGTLSAADAMKQLLNSIIRAIEQSVLLGQGPLAGLFGTQSSVPGGTGGLIGGLVGLFKSPTVAAAPPLIYGPGFASGTDFAPGGLAMVGENGPEIVNLPRGSQVIPNDVVRQSSNGSPSITFAPVIDARGADVAAVARLEQVVARQQQEFESRVIGVVRSGPSKRLF
jgi:hypothetical protein